MWQVMKLDVTQSDNASPSLSCHLKQLLHIKADAESISGSSEHQRGAATIENSCLWVLDQDVGFIMLSTWPLSTWNTQVLWLLQLPWHELSIRPFESNSPGQALSSIFPQLFGALILRSTRRLISFTSPDLPSSRLQRWRDTLPLSNSGCTLTYLYCTTSFAVKWQNQIKWVVFSCLNESSQNWFNIQNRWQLNQFPDL